MSVKEPKIFLSLGSNEGDRLAMLKQACTLIEQEVGKIRKSSSMYETEPWGMEGAEPFLNQVIQVTSSLKPQELLSVLLEIERKLGRIRDPRCAMRDTGSAMRDTGCAMRDTRLTSYVSRSIDLDILFYDSEIVETAELTIPHPHIADRRFVLVPLAEIAEEVVHPGLGKSIRQLLAECNDSGEVKKIG
ncbi:MAG: 2-amino-4-hydroxy-6-hydroxymethyldihydropteridine diphosphokinase [Bacteroidales bacterium]|nr:2-amino-4-hydroxy-6-hydroxymethyldihydropteridine diphosphokinase [Bacteroidales bacterium]